MVVFSQRSNLLFLRGFGSTGLILTTVATTLIVPVVIAAVTAALTNSDVATQDFKMLLLTNLSASDIIHGYAAAGLYRLRLLLAAATGAALFRSIFGGLAIASDSASFVETDATVLLIGILVVQALVTLAYYLVSVWLGSASGLWFGLRIRKNTTTAIGVAALTPILVWIVLAGLGALVALLVFLLTFSMDPNQGYNTGLMLFLSYLTVGNLLRTLITAAVAGFAWRMARRSMSTIASQSSI